MEAVEGARVAVVAPSTPCEDGGRLPRGTHPKAMELGVLVGVGCYWGGRVGVSGREKSFASSGGHGISDGLDVVFLLRGDAEVYPLPSLLCAWVKT